MGIWQLDTIGSEVLNTDRMNVCLFFFPKYYWVSNQQYFCVSNAVNNGPKVGTGVWVTSQRPYEEMTTGFTGFTNQFFDVANRFPWFIDRSFLRNVVFLKSVSLGRALKRFEKAYLHILLWPSPNQITINQQDLISVLHSEELDSMIGFLYSMIGSLCIVIHGPIFGCNL